MDLDHVVSSHNPDDVRRWWQMVSAHLDLTMSIPVCVRSVRVFA